MLNTPVLFLIFNRPDATQRVFEAVRRVQPRQLFIAADGPRAGRPEEADKCRQAREIALYVDWECEVKTLFREHNLGCGQAVSSAITWFFNQVAEGIILEDDTEPNPSFFRYCEEVLQYHRHHPQVMHIGGTNLQFGKKRGKATYYFSNLPHIWGWATWRRAWEQYDERMVSYTPALAEELVAHRAGSQAEKNFWLNAFAEVKAKRLDTWDHQWVFAIWKAGGVSIIPNTNLITNIGFGHGATHTTYSESRLANLPSHALDTIVHADSIAVDRNADLFEFEQVSKEYTQWTNQLRNVAYRFLPDTVLTSVKAIRKSLRKP